MKKNNIKTLKSKKFSQREYFKNYDNVRKKLYINKYKKKKTLKVIIEDST